MRKLILNFSVAALVALTGNVAQAQDATQFPQSGRAELCRRWYSSDIFNTYLRLAVTKDTSLALWIDTHIPYGIRPLPYEVTTLQCAKNNLRILGKSPIFRVEFKFDRNENGPDLQNGTLSYLDDSGNPVTAVNFECSSSAIQAFCAAQ